MDFRSHFVKFSKGCHFTVKKFYIIILNEVVELHKNFKIKSQKRVIRFFIKVILNLKNRKSKNKIRKEAFSTAHFS